MWKAQPKNDDDGDGLALAAQFRHFYHTDTEILPSNTNAAAPVMKT